tara:strand:+ start:21787 stop:22368 length:582 start_codon:yes stop_codon:yes gene_type:complete
MRPIRKEEMEYLYNDIKENFNDQKDIIKSNMIEEIDKLSSKNEIKFINKLNVQSKMKTVKEAYDTYHKFVNERELTETQLKTKLDNAIQTLTDQVNKWHTVRKWKEYDSDDLKIPENHKPLFNTLCREETEKAYYASSKGKLLKTLEKEEKRAKHILHSGQSIQNVWLHLGNIYKGCKIETLIPTEMLQLDNK